MHYVRKKQLDRPKIYNCPNICEFLAWLKSLGLIFTPTGPGQRELQTRTPIPTLHARRNSSPHLSLRPPQSTPSRRLRSGSPPPLVDPGIQHCSREQPPPRPSIGNSAPAGSLQGAIRSSAVGRRRRRARCPLGGCPPWAWPQRHSPQVHAQTGRLDAWPTRRRARSSEPGSRRPCISVAAYAVQPPAWAGRHRSATGTAFRSQCQC